ncbi:ClC family H(+)/Cl(-) exchange transporter [Limosilactobacillus fastidiosus]|uniref:ClC family H(+)/Cl(-) exchange transporter n=1 Tax=Limosilactobacillus fastidiosus TaxID=2759855 RepID=A0ABR6E7U2_9LACO|nr:ClC family H(+)/Cl(-) exchange transporter [Limosilactobacillus fastidiosus]MBB1063256.1 ClC family H(+)/Cl(-) exchange transporter [Limosilactobacillus fastidiosus]MCD7084487.1 ClC family H(+)/Cl(-) exchange transporter [Limosilactobacillus fastidiosus]
MDKKVITNQNSQVKQLIRAIIIGLLTGLVVSTFRLIIQHFLQFVQISFNYFHQQPTGLIYWAVGSVILALILGHFAQRYPNIKGSGIPQVEGQLKCQFEEKWWPVLWRKYLGGIFAIGSGLFLGREGPSIQLGATIGQGVAETAHVDSLNRRVGIASGAAAGLAAAFNAPIASTIFILEEVYHNFSPLIWLATFISSLCSNMVSMTIFGLKPVLNVPYHYELPVGLYWHLIILGVILGILGRLYQVVILHLDYWSGKLTWLKPTAYPIIPFLLVIPVAWYLPYTLGGGNQLIAELRLLPFSLSLFVGLFILRFIFSMISYGSQLPGGIFLPILTLGAVLGAAYCALMNNWGILPIQYLPNFIIYAMAGYFACISKAPFTAILLITEMVGSLAHLMPLAMVSIIAYLVVDVLHGKPVYTEMFENFIGLRTEKKPLHQETLSISVYPGSELDGCKIADYNWPADCIVSLIYRGEDKIIPNGRTVLLAGDTLVIQANISDKNKLQEILEQASHAPKM